MLWSKARSVSVALASLLITLLMVGAVSAQEGAAFTTNPFAEQTRAAVAQPTTYSDGVTFSSTSEMLSTSRAVVGLTHSQNNSTITAGNSVACNLKVNNVDVYTLENSYYRTFKLSDFGITEPLVINAVEAGIELAKPANGAATQPINLNMYVLTNPTPSVNNLTPIGSSRYDFPYIQNQFALMPARGLVFPEETLVVEINIPRGSGDGQFFYIGSNGGGETAPGYIRSPECGVNDLTTTAALGFPSMHMLINVFGVTTSEKAYNLMNNADFETDFNADNVPDVWKGKNLTGDKLKTNKAGKDYAYSGQRAFRFKGGPSEASALVQKIELETYPVIAGDQMQFTGAFSASSLPPGAVVKIKVGYVNTAIPKTKETFGVPGGSYEYGRYASAPLAVQGGVEKVKVIIQNRTPSGKFQVDTTAMIWSAVARRNVRSFEFGGAVPSIVDANAQELVRLAGGAELEALPLPSAQ
jgi:hypothetical protein